jgi:uncharacterized membrane protein YozB (DUF420 family)
MDPKLLFWSGALVNLGLVLWCVRRGIELVRADEIRAHRRHMLTAGALIVLFLVSYVGKVAWLGKEDRSAWTGLDHAVLYVHESCVAVMLVAGAVALYRAWRFRPALGPDLERPTGAPLPGGASHGRAGRIAAWAAVLSFVTAGGVLAGMFLRAAA